ncbi:MAG TPA: OmpA family protein [Methylomirabilota bacterium]|nr:OmpA family protein [Methylomirabilota bacterium]
MRIRSLLIGVTLLLALAVPSLVLPARAQEGKLKIHSVPPQAYVFIDGQAMHEASHGAFELSPGDHTIDIYNYGYKPATRKVTITAGKTTSLDVTLDAIPGNVSGPWGCMTIEGPPRDAVLLDGKTPEFFVGHIDEFNNEFWLKQELIVPPGKHQLTILQADKEVWSGSVDVPANQRVVIDIPKGVRKTVPWPRGEQLKSLPRFQAGIASATVAVALPTAQLSASNMQINCNGTTQLTWTTTDAPVVEISSLGKVDPAGQKSVQLCANTTYTLTASGPGGTVQSSLSIAVNTAIQATLSASPTEVSYRRVGDKVLEQPTTTLTWSTSNATAVSVDPLGSVDASGNRTLDISPQHTTAGPVDETFSYVLKASNPSGASETRTATVHLTGSIEPAEEVKMLETRLALRSVFFPTAQPTAENPNAGLVASQQATLQALAADFKKYLEYKPDAHLILNGHADPRGSTEYNGALSDRRVATAKQFLIDQGIPPANIETHGFGSQQDLTADQVKELVAQNPDLSAADRQKALKNLAVIVLAQNRRVDVVLSTTGEQSVRQFPFNAADSMTLLNTKALGVGKKPAPVTKTKGKTQ